MLHLPSFAGATGWLNTEPLGAKELRDRVVVVNFWALTCINWMRTEPYVRAWSHAYRDDGLVVIGVHTPEFGFEHNAELVLRSVADREIDYPVALDNEYGVWNAFNNHYWPALYFADREGVIRDQHFGEGRYELSERTIQNLLGIERDPVPITGAGVEAEADWSQLRSPETYLGYARSERFSSPDGFDFDEPRAYGLTKGLGLNEWTLEGRWTIGEERLVLDRSPGIIAYRFHARDVHLVLDSDSPDPIPFRVRLDGEAPGASHGVDVDEDGIGNLTYGRMYQLIRTDGRVRERTVEIEFLEPGARAYVFTFG
jgi:thiol-disulfide isomerase/thioredoxin